MHGIKSYSKKVSEVFVFLFQLILLLYLQKEGRLPHAVPHLDVSEVLELDLPTFHLQMGLGTCLEVLAGECSY